MTSTTYFYTTISQILDAQYHILQTHWQAACQQEPDAVHDIRVAIKRFRALMRLAHYLRPDKIERRWAKDLFADVYCLMGLIRDNHVQLSTIDHLHFTGSQYDFFRSYLWQKAALLKEQLTPKLLQFDLSKVVQSKKRIKLLLLHTNDQHSLHQLLEYLLQLRKKAKKKLQLTDEESLHDIRKYLKETQYILELLPKQADSLGLLRRINQQIGEWHDLTLIKHSLQEIIQQQPILHIHPDYLLLRKSIHSKEASERNLIQRQLYRFFNKKYKAEEIRKYGQLLQ